MCFVHSINISTQDFLAKYPLWTARDIRRNRELFSSFDHNGDCVVDFQELYDVCLFTMHGLTRHSNVMMNRLGDTSTLEQRRTMMMELDRDQSGCIDFAEFLQVCCEAVALW